MTILVALPPLFHTHDHSPSFCSRLLNTLREPEFDLHARHSAADRISDPIHDLPHNYASVAEEALTTQITPGILLHFKCVKGTPYARINVPSRLFIQWNWGRSLGFLSSATFRPQKCSSARYLSIAFSSSASARNLLTRVYSFSSWTSPLAASAFMPPYS